MTMNGRVRNAPGLDALPDATGVSAHSNTTATIHVMNRTIAIAAVGSMPGYKIFLDERIAIEVLATDMFGAPCDPTDGWVVAAEFTVTATVAAALEQTGVASAATTYVSIAGGLGAGGGGAAGDQQALAVASMMFCSGSAERRMLTNYRVLAPLATSDSFIGVVAGNGVLVGGILVMCSVAIAVRMLAFKDSLLDAMAFARFPALPHKAMLVTLQGTSFAAFQLLTQPDAGEQIALGLFAAFACVGYPMLILWFTHTRIAGEFRLYQYDKLPMNLPPIVVRVLFPVGRWSPTTLRRRFGGWVNSIRRSERLWVTQPLWGTAVMTAASVARPDRFGCAVMFGVVAALQGLLGLAHVVFQPHRCVFANILSASGGIVVAIFISLTGSNLLHPSDAKVAAIIAVTQLQTALSVARIGYTFFVIAIETAKLGDKLEQITAFRWSCDGGRKREYTMAAEPGGDDGGVDGGGDALMAPLLVATATAAVDEAELDEILGNDALADDTDSLLLGPDDNATNNNGPEDSDAPETHETEGPRQPRVNLTKHELHDELKRRLTIGVRAEPLPPAAVKSNAPAAVLQNSGAIPPLPPPPAPAENENRAVDGLFGALLDAI